MEFGKGITAVVGPNGSGKSNIADSIRWVLGEQSLKQLRGKKSEDVIFAGSEKKSRLSFAEASVTFDNEDRRIPLDYAEVSITRRIDRSGESEYLINGNKVRLLDVVDLVLKSNIGTSRYTVIGQGTIDQMILAGPSEIKNLIDEASGVKTYYIRRERTMRRLEQSAQNLMRVKDLLAEIEPRLKSLRRQAKKMQERSAIEQELKTYQEQFYSGKIWRIKDLLSELEGKLNVLSLEREKLQGEMEAGRRAIEKSESENQNETAQYAQVQSEIKKLNERKNRLFEDISVIRGKLQAQSPVGAGNGKSLELEKNNLESAKNRLQAEILSAKKDSAEIEGRILSHKAAFSEISLKLDEIQKNLSSPEGINIARLAEDVNELDSRFGEFYESIREARDVFQIMGHAEKFREEFGAFKRRALKFSENPFSDFEKQKKILQEVLAKKDDISQELSRLELQKTKMAMSSDYYEKEIAKADERLLQVNLELSRISAANPDEYLNGLLSEEKKLDGEIAALASEISSLEDKIAKYHAGERGKKEQILAFEREYRKKQDQLSKIKDQESALQVEKARLDTQNEGLLSECIRALGQEVALRLRNDPPIMGGKGADPEEKIRKLENQLEVIGGIDELTMQEYRETEARFSYLSGQVEDLQKATVDLRQVIEELDAHIKKTFSNSFEGINEKFQNYFRVLFNGGRAYLSVIKAQTSEKENAESQEGDSEEERENSQAERLRPEEKIIKKYEHSSDEILGIDIKATPPGKKLSSISALSGGERSLTSIALLCALLSCFPSPFVMLDEVDAALDEANTIRFAQILGTLSSYTQFITVTHNRETMREANILYGVTMGEDGVSKLLSLKIDQAQAYAK